MASYPIASCAATIPRQQFSCLKLAWRALNQQPEGRAAISGLLPKRKKPRTLCRKHSCRGLMSRTTSATEGYHVRASMLRPAQRLAFTGPHGLLCRRLYRCCIQRTVFVRHRHGIAREGVMSSMGPGGVRAVQECRDAQAGDPPLAYHHSSLSGSPRTAAPPREGAPAARGKASAIDAGRSETAIRIREAAR